MNKRNLLESLSFKLIQLPNVQLNQITICSLV
jgi:hypothetical protein